MRAIVTKEEREGKERRNKTIIGIILVGIMIFSTAGFAFNSLRGNGEEAEKINYNGLEFALKEDGLWHFNIQEQEFATEYNPIDTENISIPVYANLQNYLGKPLYFSFNSRNEGINEITRNIGRYVERTQKVCITECEEDLPVKNCTDNIIIIEKRNETLINQEENCIYILSDDVVKAGDAFVFKLLGI